VGQRPQGLLTWEVTKRSLGGEKGSRAFLNWVFQARFRHRFTPVMKNR
jgi:hypothetical protein